MALGRGEDVLSIFLNPFLDEQSKSPDNLFLNFMDYEQAIDSVHKKALIMVISLFIIQDMYIKINSATSKNNISEVETGSEVCSWLTLESRLVVPYPSS